MIVRAQKADDYEAIRHVYAEALRRPRFRRPQNPGSVAPEVGLFDALWEAGDAIPEFSFTALTDGGVVGHVTASEAIVATDPVVAVGAARPGRRVSESKPAQGSSRNTGQASVIRFTRRLHRVGVALTAAIHNP